MLSYEISPAEAAQILREKGARLVDVREPWEFATTRIEDSLPIPMGEVPTRAHKELDVDERLGFEKAQSLRGGIDAWSVEVDPKVARY